MILSATKWPTNVKKRNSYGTLNANRMFFEALKTKESKNLKISISISIAMLLFVTTDFNSTRNYHPNKLYCICNDITECFRWRCDFFHGETAVKLNNLCWARTPYSEKVQQFHRNEIRVDRKRTEQCHKKFFVDI